MSETLVRAQAVTVRPMATGCIVLVGDEPPLGVGGLHEQILSMCARTVTRDELTELLVELGASAEQVDTAVEALVEHGALTSST